MPEEYQRLDMPAEYKNTSLGHYLQSVHYMDHQIGYFLNLLEEEGLYENSAIIIYGDHQGLDSRNVEIEELVSRFWEKYTQMMKCSADWWSNRLFPHHCKLGR